MARKESLFIGETVYKALSPLSGTLDYDYVRPHVICAQDMRIQPILGSKLFWSLQEKIEDNSLSEDEQLLIDDYITKCMVWWVTYDSALYLLVKLSNSGITQKSTAEEVGISFSDARILKAESKGKAEFYTQRLIDFLELGNYPDYNIEEDNEGGMVPTTSNYSGPFIF